jgi:large subunit ribosomal protein L19
MQKIQEFNQKVRGSIQRPEIQTGDIIKVHRKITEGNKERIQVFEGIVIAIKGKQSSSPMVTVRRVSFNVGVEITVPLYSPAISKIEVVKRAKIRRSKLYYLRKKDFRMSKLKMKDLDNFVVKEEKEASEEKKKETVAVEKKEAEESAESEEK